MNTQREAMQISEVRAVVAQLTQERPISGHAVQAARGAMQQLFEEAAERGLTSAEVVKAILLPIFEKKPFCDCPTCAARRAAVLGEAGNERAFATLS